MIRPRPAVSGFTLIEILIALAILALISVLGVRAVASLTDSEARLAAESERWRALDGFFARFEADMRKAQPREVRSGGETEPGWLGIADGRGNSELRFSRAGPEFEIELGSAGNRIGYRLRDGAIEVLYWPHFDQPAGAVPVAYSLVDGVAQFRVTYLDLGGGWRDRWPALGEPAVPRAVRVQLLLVDGAAIERWLTPR